MEESGMAAFTKQAIRDSFVKLLNEKPLSQITVREVVEDCKVNRNTFYYYYSDIPHLLESIVDEDVERIIQEHPAIDSLEDCVNVAFSFAVANRKAAMHIYRSVNRDIYERYLWRVCDHVVTIYVDRNLTERSIAADDRTVLIDYLKAVCFGTTMGWLEAGMPENVQDKLRRICELKQGDLERLLTRCKEGNGSFDIK
jgi:AcrR family transcriptional regulator